MLNIELYAKQLDGFDVSNLMKKEKKIVPKPDIEMNYYAYLRGRGNVGFISSINSKRQRGCNVKLIFDGETNLLKNVLFVEIKHK